MPISIDSTVGGASANSFVSLAEAQSFMDGRLNSTNWDAASTDSKNRALVEATREISVLGFVGRRVATTQSLSWPRWDAPNPDDAQGWLYTSTEIPQRVKDATSELAFQFLNAGTSDIASLPSDSGIIEKTVDVLTTRWAEPYNRPKGLRLYPRVWNYLLPLLESSPAQMPIVRG